MVNSAIFEPGQICDGSYSIERFYACSAAAESYLAKHITTGQEVVLTCSWLNQGASSILLRRAFVSKALKLRTIAIEDNPRVVDGGVTDRGVYWVACEYFADAVPIWSLFNPEKLSLAQHTQMSALLQAGNEQAYLTMVVCIGFMVAEVLRRYANIGVCHGGIDLARTIAMRADGTIIVLETGYRELFGSAHCDGLPDLEAYRAPEAGDAIDAKCDIYSLGAGLRGLLLRGMMQYRLARLPNLLKELARLHEADPSKRLQSWSDVSAQFETAHGQLTGEPSSAPKSGARPKVVEIVADTDRAPGALATEREAPEPTPRVLEAPRPVSNGVDKNERVADAPSNGSDEVPTPRVPVSVPIRGTHPVKIDADSNAKAVILGTDPPLPSPPGRERAVAARLLSVAASAVAVLVGLAALRAVPSLMDRVLDTRATVDNARRRVDISDQSDSVRESAPYRAGDSLPRLIVDQDESGRPYSGTRKSLKWTASFDIMTPSRKLRNE